MGDSVKKYFEMNTTADESVSQINYEQMKESELLKMKHDLKIAQQALVVALEKIKRLEDATFKTKEVRDK